MSSANLAKLILGQINQYVNPLRPISAQHSDSYIAIIFGIPLATSGTMRDLFEEMLILIICGNTQATGSYHKHKVATS